MKTKTFRLEEIVLGKEGLLKGPFGSDLKRSLYVPKDSSTYKVYLQENILKSDLTKGTHHISNDYFVSKMSRYAVKEGDFIVTCDGTLGEIFRLNGLKEKGIISSSLLRITLNESKVDPIFFPYLWSTRIKKPLIRSHNNSVLKHLPGLKAIRAFTIELPSLAAQKSIAKVLSDIDAKIVLNNKINAELQSMAKLIYDYWFLQFDFPDENGNPYKSSGGKMIYNEELKRETPEGWISGGFERFSDIKGGSTPSKSNNSFFTEAGKGLSWITPKDLSNNTGNVFIKSGKTDVTEDGLRNANLKILPKGSVLMSSRAPIGYVAINSIESTTNQGFKSFVPKEKSITEFLYFTIKSSIPIIEQFSSGSTFKEISASTLRTIQIAIPPASLIEGFNELTDSIFKSIELREQESNELVRLRDWLLPMLMNGQVTIKD